MTGKTWVLVGSDSGVSNLLDMARSLGADVIAAVAGSKDLADTMASTGVSKVYWLDGGGAPVEAYALQVAATLAETEGQPGLVVAGSSPQDRVLLGAVAARLQCPLLSGAHTLSADGEALLVQRSVFGGIGEQTDRIVGPLALMLEGGAPVEASAPAAPVERVEVAPAGLTVTETRAAEYEAVDVGAATRVVTVGRGVKAKEDLGLVESLAAALGAQVACSRPLAEGLDWYPKDRYVGVSGLKLSPNLYVAVGVSGQLQHMVGARESEVIVAINSDKNAPVFAECDYGIVGDLYAVVPALTKALS
ncbi:MAG: electron transfer flavoprotein subunit alpha/FixB family protein [Dermatophilaceae bacterium]